MNYQRIYDEFIADRREKESLLTGYTENHHIIPRSLGGNNLKENLIRLTAQDHYFAHELLAKIHGGSMWSALFFMSSKESHSAKGAKANRSMYELSKIESSKNMSRRMKGENNTFFGKSHSKEVVKKIIETRVQVVGENHHEYNHTIVSWENINGEKFTGTQNSLRKKYNLSHKPISEVFWGKRKSYKGWFSLDHQTLDSVMNKGFMGLSHHKTDHKIYTFKNKDGRLFTGKRQEFYKTHNDVTESGVRAICKGNNKSHNGWTVEKVHA